MKKKDKDKESVRERECEKSTPIMYPPKPTVNQVKHCQFSSWYPTFKSHTIKSRIIKPLSDTFINYLEADGIVLPLDG